MPTERNDGPSLEDQPNQPAPDAPQQEAPEAGPGTSEPPELNPEDYFSDKFDPALLPDELRPAYKQMQGAFTKKTQSLSQEKQRAVEEALTDPDFQRRAFEAWGLVEEEEDDLYQDNLEAIPPAVLNRLEALEKRDQEFQARAREEALNSYVNDQIDALEDSTGREFSKAQAEALGNLALSRPPGPEGMPDISGAYEFLFTDVLGDEKKRWTGKKKGSPKPGGPGSAADKQPNLGSDEERIDFMAERLKEIDAAS
jgi:hypothetical protein